LVVEKVPIMAKKLGRILSGICVPYRQICKNDEGIKYILEIQYTYVYLLYGHENKH
jgi:hypothetical protein